MVGLFLRYTQKNFGKPRRVATASLKSSDVKPMNPCDHPETNVYLWDPLQKFKFQIITNL